MPFCHPAFSIRQGSRAPPKCAIPLRVILHFGSSRARFAAAKAVPDRCCADGLRIAVLNDRTVQSKEQIMSHSIAYQGHFYSEDELHEALWLVQIELRNGLPADEKREAEQQITELNGLLKSLHNP
jgi:hypothetical protein